MRRHLTIAGLMLVAAACSATSPREQPTDGQADTGAVIDTSSGGGDGGASDGSALEALAAVLGEMEGEARAAGTTGGKNGAIYRVTSLEDDPASPQPGSLRHALLGGDRWIRFDVSGTIVLRGDLYVKGNNITIDGRGAQIKLDHGEAPGLGSAACAKITAYSLVAEKVDNLVLLNLTLAGHYTETTSECNGADLFAIYGSDRVWVHHVTFLDATEHGIDMRSNSNGKALQDDPSIGVTVSCCRFAKVAAVNFRTLQSGTFHHNYCDGPHQSCPRVGLNCNANLAKKIDGGCKDWAPVSWEAKLHVYNNYYRDWPTAKLIVTNDVMQDDDPTFPARPKELFLLSQYDMFEAHTQLVATSDSQWDGNNLRVENYNDTFGRPITLPDLSAEKTMTVSATALVEKPASAAEWEALAEAVKSRAGATL